MSVHKVDPVELIGDRIHVLVDDEIPAGWRKGFRALAARNKAKKDRVCCSPSKREECPRLKGILDEE